MFDEIETMNNEVNDRYVDISISIPHRYTSFVDRIIESGIVDSGLDSRYVYFDDVRQHNLGAFDKEFYALLENFGISEKEFREW